MAELNPKDVPDIEIHDQGSIVLVVPVTTAGREWIEENVQPEGWQWFGGGLAVEPRYVENLCEGMMESGLVIA